MTKTYSSLDFFFDKDRSSSTILIIGEPIDFQINKFIKKYYGIDNIKDEGESQCYLYLSSLKNFKLNKSNYASNFNYVDIKSTKIENIYKELVDKNFDEVWFYNGKTFDNIVNLIFQSDEEALSNLTSVLGLKNIVSKGLIFDVVAF